MRRAKRAIAELAEEVESIQKLNGEINEAGYSEDLRENVGEGLKRAVAGMREAADRAEARLKEVEAAAGLDGRDVAAAAAELAAIRASAAALLAAGRPGNASVSYVGGTVAQPDPATSPAKLHVSIGPVAAAPYWIVDAAVRSGPGFEHYYYSAALVFSCSSSRFPGSVSKSLFILSRRPRLDPHIVRRFLAKAGSLGIYNDCNDPFLFTLQRGGNCGRVLASAG
jgi:hypothetical protein